MSDVAEVVVGATRKELRVPFEDENGNPVNITGATVRLQGTSEDIASTIDVAGVIYDGPNGIARWTQLGGTGFVTDAELGVKSEATFTLRAKLTDAGGLVDYSPAFKVKWVKAPAI